MAIKRQTGSGSTSRDYRKGLKSALKANKYKPTSQAKGQYTKISSQLAKKAKAGDKNAQGAAAAYSMLRQEKAMSNRGGGGTASAIAKKGGKKVAQKALVGVIKANRFKPTASKIKNSNYGVLDEKLRRESVIGKMRGDKGAVQRAEGARRGISVMRQDAAAARRGTVDRTGPNKKVAVKPSTPATKTKTKSPITSIGGYVGKTWDGKKIQPLTTSGTKANIKIESFPDIVKKATKSKPAKKTTTPKKKPKTTAPKGTISIGGITMKKR